MGHVSFCVQSLHRGFGLLMDRELRLPSDERPRDDSLVAGASSMSSSVPSNPTRWCFVPGLGGEPEIRVWKLTRFSLPGVFLKPISDSSRAGDMRMAFGLMGKLARLWRPAGLWFS